MIVSAVSALISVCPNLLNRSKDRLDLSLRSVRASNDSRLTFSDGKAMPLVDEVPFAVDGACSQPQHIARVSKTMAEKERVK